MDDIKKDIEQKPKKRVGERGPNKTTAPEKEAMIVALNRALGNVSVCCKEVGISRQTHYNWLETDPEYAQAVMNINEKVIDNAEAMLNSSIMEGNVTAIIFFLKTKGRSRGYTEHYEITGKDGKDLIPEKFTPSEIKVSVVSNTA